LRSPEFSYFTSTPSISFVFQCYRPHRNLHSFPTTTLFRSKAPARMLIDRPFAARQIAHAGNAVDHHFAHVMHRGPDQREHALGRDRKSTRLNSSHVKISYAVFCLKKKKKKIKN